MTRLSQKVRTISISVIAVLCIVSTFSFANSQNTSPIRNTPESESSNADNFTGISTTNHNGLQIILRNDTAGISKGDERIYNLIVPIITAVGAISGAIAGTYFTGRATLNLEKKRIEEQRRKEDEILQGVQRLVYTDLKWISAILGQFLKDENPSEQTKSDFKTVMNVERQYFSLSIEMKVSSFSPHVLENLEKTYGLIRLQAEVFKAVWPKYEFGEITFRELSQRLSLNHIKNACVASSDLLKPRS